LPDQTEQRGIEGALLDEQRLPGDLSDAQQNAVTVKRAKGNSFENEKIESAGKKLGSVGHGSPPKILRRLVCLS
jgi:hypothetical protein